MYFYNSLLLVSNILTLTVHTQSQDLNGIGISACGFYGARAEDCGLSDVPISKIPVNCLSIFFDGVTVDLRYHVGVPCMCNPNFNQLDKILKMKGSKRVFLLYGHTTIQEWTAMLACESCNGGTNSLDEMKGLKAFLDEHPGIDGLVLTSLEYDDDSDEFMGYSENLKTYLEVMKKSFPNLFVGLDLSGRFLIDHFTNPRIPWLDITTVDSVTDFYVVSVVFLNECTSNDFRNGIAPITASYTNYTLDKLKDVLKQASIPKEKIHFKFKINPTSDPNDSFTYCDLTMEKICLQPQETCTWCVDTLTSFNEKGNYANKYGAGFIGSSIDFNDPDNCCNCEKPFPGFNAILDGFNGVTTKPCDLLNRN
ncbi:uncharacterized protein LOC113558038 [Rhopalosiphum maidis]|uniref:uncharacterized protein LOC113558038 n=1 Tax=Rhopalosiphum maidis TaxID=43146 RepID=UPI000EFDCF95|nr:uncharacterized protein LOC113558038 [Rhopalosiphum maidis]